MHTPYFITVICYLLSALCLFLKMVDSFLDDF
jgi:hypothetical protein